MNTDDFEKKLQRQTMRPVLAEWREEILAAARAPERRVAADNAILLWRLIFARFPVAWGALAAVWIVLIAINLLLFGTSSQSAARQQFVSTTEPSSIWQLQSAELQQIASGDPSISGEVPANLPAATPHSPRSERHREDGVGEIILERPPCFIA